MARIFNRRTDKSEETPISFGQVYQIPQEQRQITLDTSKPTNVLEKLKHTNNKYDAIDIIVNETPDGKMAYNTYLRIANQGVKVQFVNSNTGRPTKKYDSEWRIFCANMGGNTSEGLDGVIDQLHGSSVTHGGMAVEVVVEKGAKGISSVIVIDPKTITELKWLDEKKRYAAYQQVSSGGKKDLYDGNFFFIPYQPKPGQPVGTLLFEPAISTMIDYYQTKEDISVILKRVGFPKYDVSIDLEKLIASMPPDVLADRERRNKYIESNFNAVKNGMMSIGRDSNLIHYNSTKVDVIGGGVNGSGLDVRAWNDIYEPLIVNSFSLTPVLLGRLKSGSYSLGTAEYKIVKDNMETLRRGSKRMIESIANIWARVNGYNVKAIVTHNPIEWQIETEKCEAQLLKMQKARRAEEYKYISHEEAAIMAIGDDADPQEGKGDDRYEYLKSAGESTETNNVQQSEKGKNNDNQAE